MEYFRTSIEEERRNKERYAAEAQAYQLRPKWPPWFDVGHGFVVEEED